MKRLTYWNDDLGRWCYHGPSEEAAKHLAAYENAMPLERIQELAEADRDGWLLVLPPKNPLTLDDLRKMDGEAVRCVDGKGNKCYCLVNCVDRDNETPFCYDNERKEKKMAKYIEKNELLKQLRRELRECEKDGEENGGEAIILAEGIECAIDIVKDMPSADVAPVVHGQWIRVRWVKTDDPDGGYWIVSCSQCSVTHEKERPFCPSCGAKMDLK